MKRSIAAAVALAAVAGCSSSTTPLTVKTVVRTVERSTPTDSQPFDATGHLTLLGPVSTSDDRPKDGAVCYGISSGTENFEDLASGAEVTVYDENNQVVGAGALDAGQMTRANPLGRRECDFDWTVTNVEPGHRFYTLQIGSQNTDRISEADLRSGPSVTIRSLAYTG